jgi:ABC-type lipoprotein export system ATPase subunit
MLSCKDIVFSYGEGQDFSFPDLQCKQGEHLLILGQSGTGKTTLLHLIAGLLKPTSGLIEIDGVDIATRDQEKVDKFRGEKVGIVFQTPHFIDSLNVIDNLIMPQFLSGRKVDRDKAMEKLTRLGLADKYKKKTRNLSVGEQQRVAIARALVNDPALILADEPTSALDDFHTNEVIDLLSEQAADSNSALVIVTHDKRLKDRFSNRVEL